MSQELTLDRIKQSSLLYCVPQTPLYEAAGLMAERQCSSILVMKDNRVAGIWTERDSLQIDFDDPAAVRTPISQVMNRSVVSLPAETPVSEAADYFTNDHCHHLLVTGADGKPQGIVSRTDIILHQGLEPYLRLREVHSVMQTNPLTLSGRQSLSQLVRVMRESNADAVIVELDYEAGIITERDLVRFVACHPGHTVIGELASRPLLSIRTDDTLINARELMTRHRARHLAVCDRGVIVGLLSFADMMSATEQQYLDALRDVLDKRDEALAKSRYGLQLAERVIESSLEGIIITDDQTRIEFVNPAFTRLTGYSLEEAVGRTPAMLSSGRHDTGFYQQMWSGLQEQGYWRGEIWNRHKTGQLFLELLTVTAIRDERDEITHFAALFSDITHLHESERQVRQLAYYDALTGLPNRRLLEDRLAMAMRQAQREACRVAVIFIDIDHFKEVNDSLGHAVGDKLLMDIAARLNACIRGSDTLSRLGGDEFIALLPDVAEEDGASQVARRIIDAITIPFELGGRKIRVGCSLGISLYPDDGVHGEQLIHNADSAMYRAKSEGRSTWCFYRADP